MRNVCGFPVFFVAAIAVVQPLGAQSGNRTGSFIRDKIPAEIPIARGTLSEPLARQVSYDFGLCVVQTYHKRVNEIAGFTLKPAQVNDVMKRLANDDCLMGGTLTIPEMLMRGAIFRGLYLRDFAKAQPELQAMPVDYEPISGGTDMLTAEGYATYMNFADCVVRAEPAGARALTMAKPATPKETEAIAQLSPKLGQCMPAGNTVKLNRASLAALVSEALYRQAKAAVPPVAGSRK